MYGGGCGGCCWEDIVGEFGGGGGGELVEVFPFYGGGVWEFLCEIIRWIDKVFFRFCL